MPLSSNQLAALVERARHKAPPVVSPPLPAPSPATAIVGQESFDPVCVCRLAI
jgi:hypothetical protein